MWLLAAFFIFAGLNHFRNPGLYLAIMPPALPWPMALVDISGIAEIAGGMGILFRPLRYAAGIGLVALLVAVFPANVYMASHHILPAGIHVAPWLLWVRLPLQGVLIAWVWWTACSAAPSGVSRDSLV